MDFFKSKEEKEQVKAEATERRVVGIGEPVHRVKCACGNRVELESPQLDQCLACFNRK